MTKLLPKPVTLALDVVSWLPSLVQNSAVMFWNSSVVTLFRKLSARFVFKSSDPNLSAVFFATWCTWQIRMLSLSTWCRYWLANMPCRSAKSWSKYKPICKSEVEQKRDTDYWIKEKPTIRTKLIHQSIIFDCDHCV